MAIFYHVTMDLFHNGRFVPRVPSIRAEAEDDKIPRVCVSKHVEGCFTSVPYGNIKLDKANNLSNGLYKLFKIDTDKLNIPEKNIIYGEKLYERSLVIDAFWTDEAWITVPFQVPEEDVSIIVLNSWEEDESENVPFEIRQIADEEMGGCVEGAWYSKNSYPLPYIVTIEEVDYESIDMTDEVTLYGNELEYLLLKKHMKLLDVDVKYTPYEKVDTCFLKTDLNEDTGLIIINYENEDKNKVQHGLLDWKKKLERLC